MQTAFVSMWGHVAGPLHEEATLKLASNIPTILEIVLRHEDAGRHRSLLASRQVLDALTKPLQHASQEHCSVIQPDILYPVNMRSLMDALIKRALKYNEPREEKKLLLSSCFSRTVTEKLLISAEGEMKNTLRRALWSDKTQLETGANLASLPLKNKERNELSMLKHPN